MKKEEIYNLITKALEQNHDFSSMIADTLIQSDSVQKYALNLIEDIYDIQTLRKEELEAISLETMELIHKRIKKLYSDSKVSNAVFDSESNVHKLLELTSEDFIQEINNPVNSLINYHQEADKPDSLIALLTVVKTLEQEDELKKLQLNESQYKEWLDNIDNILITTKQFETLYGISIKKQTRLRGLHNDPLPVHFQHKEETNDNPNSRSKILYNRKEVDKWMENYKPNS